MGKKDNTTRGRIVGCVLTLGSPTISQITKDLNISRPAIYAHLDILEKEGIIKREKKLGIKGSPVHITLNQEGMSMQEEEGTLRLLSHLKEHGGEMPSFDLQDFENRDSFSTPIMLSLMMKGYITQKTFLTPEGEKFLAEHKQKLIKKN